MVFQMCMHHNDTSRTDVRRLWSMYVLIYCAQNRGNALPTHTDAHATGFLTVVAEGHVIHRTMADSMAWPTTRNLGKGR